MRWARVLGVAVLAACATTMPGAAQQGRLEIAKRGWLGFSPVFSPNTRAGLEIRAVSDGSPAERAGIQPGDTLLEVNGITATPPLVMSLGSSLAPGDTVRLRLRRDGRDRTLTLEAAERSANHVWTDEGGRVIAFSPDTLRRRLLILADSLRVYADTFRMPNVYFQWNDDGERFRGYWRGPDSIPFPWDIEADTAWRRRFAADIDSLASAYLPPFEARAMPGVATLGLRAVAGAELTDLTPGLARAFKTRSGVLVLRVPDDTPARRAGLAEADVIVRANGAGVASVSELRRIIAHAHSASDPARLEVLRDGKRVVLVLRRR